MTDNSLFSFNSDGQQPLQSEDIFRDRNGTSYDQSVRQQALPPLSSYFSSSDVFSPLQLPHQPAPDQLQPMMGYPQPQARPPQMGMGMGHAPDRQGPLTPPGSPSNAHQQQAVDHQNNAHETKPSVNGMVAALASAGVTDPSIAPAIARALSHQSRARPRVERKTIPDDNKDDRYFERRKRNNAAAKKSRDTRKKREDEIAIRASFLEKENAILRAQVATLREEANSLRQLLLQRRSRP